LGVGGEGVSECEVDKALMDVIDQVQVSTRYADNPYGDPFLVLSQTRKDAGDSGLEVADLLGSADLGYRASNVLMLEPAERTARHNDFTPLALRILKGRDGVTRTTIPLEFHHRVTQFKTLGETAQSKKATNTAVTLNPYGGTR
jgi:hypothetical protein